MTVVAIPVFSRLRSNGHRYRMPSGREAVITSADQLQDGIPVVTLRYVDNGEEVTVLKRWLNAYGVPA